MGQSNSTKLNQEHDRQRIEREKADKIHKHNRHMKQQEHKKHQEFNRNVLMILANDSHDMFNFFNANLLTHTCKISCTGDLFEKQTLINYDDNNANVVPEGVVQILYFDKKHKYEFDNFCVNIVIHVKQNCVHNVKNKQFTVTGYNSFDSQYKIQQIQFNQQWKQYNLKSSPLMNLDDDEQKKYGGTINVSTCTNLIEIVGKEPTC
jgi:hypothetical protein